METFDVGDGLPSATIYDLAQDPSGRLWILSRAGITEYDGRELRTFSSGEGLSGRPLSALAVGPGGRVWTVERSGKTVHVLEGASWRRRSQPPPGFNPATN